MAIPFAWSRVVFSRAAFAMSPRLSVRHASGVTSDQSHPVWRLGRLNHVAIATPNLDQSVSLYRDVMGADVR